LPSINSSKMQINNFTSRFQNKLFLALIFASIPIISFYIWKLCSIQKNVQKFLITLIIYIGAIIATKVRYNMLLKYIKQSQEFSLSNDIKALFAYDEMNYPIWIIGGILISSVLIVTIFKNLNPKPKNKN
jgi:hypothetical protein